jgi:hypothetical protein
VADLHSARAYFLQVVIPEYETMLETLTDGVFGTRRDIRALGRASEACLHLADHVCRDPTCNSGIAGAPKSTDYVDLLTKTHEPFAIARDIANSFKHRSIGRPDALVRSLDSLSERWVLIRHEDADGYYYSIRKSVLVELTDKRILAAEEAINRCLTAWGTELIRLGVVPTHPRVDHGPSAYVPRTACPARPSITMLADEGEYFEAQPLIVVADAINKTLREATGELIDTQVDINWRIYSSRFAARERTIIERRTSTLTINNRATAANPPSA